MEFDKDLVEKLAEAAHEIFCDELRAKGYRFGPETRDSGKEHGSLKHYADLSEYEKDKNRDFIRDIPRKLLSVSYGMRPSRRNEAVTEFSKSDIEKLAQTEHERWMHETIAGNAKRGQTMNETKKSRRNLVPWDKLPDNEKNKDRALVEGIPRILAQAGYVIVKRAE